MMLFLAIPIATLGAYFLTRLVIAWAPKLGLVQVPNSRSSHVRPTPTGGGLAISIVSLCLGLALTSFGALLSPNWAFWALAAVMAALGAVDDVKDLSPILRLVIQSIVIILSALMVINSLDASSVLSALIIACVVFSSIWWVNLFNFMDGIDGLASSQSIIFLIFFIVVSFFNYGLMLDNQYSLLSFVVCASVIGFVPNNWSPAKIFMGDSGSIFISFVVLIQMMNLVSLDVIGFGAAISLVSVFVTDATVTLARRLIAGHLPWSAHRQHAYQKLARNYGHKKVTLSYAALTLCWAVPLAGLATIFRSLELWISIACYTPLLAAAILVGSGREEV